MVAVDLRTTSCPGHRIPYEGLRGGYFQQIAFLLLTTARSSPSLVAWPSTTFS